MTSSTKETDEENRLEAEREAAGERLGVWD